MTTEVVEDPRIARTARRYVVLVLHLDRHLISVLLGPVRSEFQPSDSQLGLLSGIAFAALFSLVRKPAHMNAARHPISLAEIPAHQEREEPPQPDVTLVVCGCQSRRPGRGVLNQRN